MSAKFLKETIPGYSKLRWPGNQRGGGQGRPDWIRGIRFEMLHRKKGTSIDRWGWKNPATSILMSDLTSCVGKGIHFLTPTLSYVPESTVEIAAQDAGLLRVGMSLALETIGTLTIKGTCSVRVKSVYVSASLTSARFPRRYEVLSFNFNGMYDKYFLFVLRNLRIPLYRSGRNVVMRNAGLTRVIPIDKEVVCQKITSQI